MQLPQNTHTHFSLSHSHFPCHVLIFSSRQCYTEYETTTHLPTHTLDTCFWEMWMNVSQKRPWRHSIQYGLVLQWWVTQLCVLVCVHVGVCACTTKGRQAHVGAESYINHTQNQLESINVRRPTAVGVLVLGLMLAWLQTHHTLTIPPRARTHSHTSRLKARHKHSESLGVDVMQRIILHESNPKMKCD